MPVSMIGSANATAIPPWNSPSTGPTKETGSADADGPSSRAMSSGAASLFTTATTRSLQHAGASAWLVGGDGAHEANASTRPTREEAGQGPIFDSEPHRSSRAGSRGPTRAKH